MRIWRHVAVVVLLASVGVWLIVRTARETVSAPYRIDPSLLSGWAVVLLDPQEPGDGPLLVLRPPRQVGEQLFQQIFRRTMESFVGPRSALVPVVLREEYETSLRGTMTPGDVQAIADAAGLAEALLEPVCIGHRMQPAGGRTRRVYYAVFASAAFDAFRRALHRELTNRGGSGFDVEAVSLVLPVAASDEDAAKWPLSDTNPMLDCEAPLV